MRLDSALVERGLARSRSRAAQLISQGKVFVDGLLITKASHQVAEASDLSLKGANAHDYASRAAFKLLRTLEAIPQGEALVSGAQALDVGASTGGFTDVLLRYGASEVVALDVGHDQLVDSIRNDPRVHVVEGYNARNLVASDLPFEPSLIVSDVSFISLTLLMPALARTVAHGGDLLLMVKPQFEVGKASVGAGGVVRDPALHVLAISRVVECARGEGLELVAVSPSALPGPHGNREYFVWLRDPRMAKSSASATVVPSGSEPAADEDQERDRAYARAINLAVDSAHSVGARGAMTLPNGVPSQKAKGMPSSDAVAETSVFWVKRS